MIKNDINVVIILENIEVLLKIFVISDRKHQKKFLNWNKKNRKKPNKNQTKAKMNKPVYIGLSV